MSRATTRHKEAVDQIMNSSKATFNSVDEVLQAVQGRMQGS
jgi:hypothetical protein